MTTRQAPGPGTWVLDVSHFDRPFTKHFEEELDDIETAKMTYRQVLDEFWGPFSTALKVAEEKMPVKRGVETGEMCPKCGKPLVKNFSKKTGRDFIGCSGFREGCKYIKSLPVRIVVNSSNGVRAAGATTSPARADPTARATSRLTPRASRCRRQSPRDTPARSAASRW